MTEWDKLSLVEKYDKLMEYFLAKRNAHEYTNDNLIHQIDNLRFEYSIAKKYAIQDTKMSNYGMDKFAHNVGLIDAKHNYMPVQLLRLSPNEQLYRYIEHCIIEDVSLDRKAKERALAQLQNTDKDILHMHELALAYNITLYDCQGTCLWELSSK